MILPLTPHTVIILNSFLSLFVVVSLIGFSVEQAIKLFKEAKNA